jgi:hypothetical protein
MQSEPDASLEIGTESSASESLGSLKAIVQCLDSTRLLPGKTSTSKIAQVIFVIVLSYQ